jgi:hypothetical protein
MIKVHKDDLELLKAEGWVQGTWWSRAAVETGPWKREGSSGYYIWHRHQTGNECIQVAVTLNPDDYLERDNGSVSEALMRRLIYCETEEITTEYDENQGYRI